MAKHLAHRSGFYVYHLVDPRDGSVFYVGKGIKRRAWQHEKQAITGRHVNPLLASRILAIIAAGARLEVKQVMVDLTEAEAFERERAEIKSHSGLCNLSPGQLSWQEHQRLWASNIIRRFKPYRVWLRERPRPQEAREMYLLVLKAVAKHFAEPQPNTYTKTTDGWVGSWEPADRTPLPTYLHL